MTLRGPDISHHQNDAGLNLGVFLAAVDFVIVKASQYTGYVDPRFEVNMTAARKAGKLRGAYHYAGPSDRSNPKPPGDPRVEAEHFVSVAGHQPGELAVLDYEPQVPPADPDGWCATFLTRVRELTGVLPVVYMSEATSRERSWSRTRALGPRLWVARYGPDNGAMPALKLNVGQWGSYLMWQFTSKARLPGASAGLDLNEFYGDASTWLALGGNGSAPTQEEDDMAYSEADLTRIVQEAVWGGATLPRGGTAAIWRLIGIDEKTSPFLGFHSDPAQGGDGTVALAAPGFFLPVPSPTHLELYKAHGVVGKIANVSPAEFDHFRVLFAAPVVGGQPAIDTAAIVAQLNEALSEVQAQKLVDEIGERLSAAKEQGEQPPA